MLNELNKTLETLNEIFEEIDISQEYKDYLVRAAEDFFHLFPVCIFENIKCGNRRAIRSILFFDISFRISKFQKKLSKNSIFLNLRSLRRRKSS